LGVLALSKSVPTERLKAARTSMSAGDTPRVGTADDQLLRLLAVSGKTSREIATEIDRSVDAVQARAKKLGLSLKQVTVRRRL
jgi:hypothetical protein